MEQEINLLPILKNKKVLALSDTGYPYPYIRDFCKQLSQSIVHIYVSPATTSRFLKLYISVTGNNRTRILKDKKFLLFNHIEPEDYIVVIFFGSKITKETRFLTVLAQKLVILNYNIITVTEEGIDYDADNPIFKQ
jgi:hypothetical protein